MGFVNPSVAFVISLCFLGVMLYKHVNLGISLNATAMLLALLSLDWQSIPSIIYQTTIDPLTVAVVLATFGIMLLSQLYKETGVIKSLSESASGIIKNSKIVSILLPAIIGFLPVAGGALMSAPLVDSEAEKLGLKPEKKAYVNIWFRHTLLPIYPISQILVITAALSGIAMPLIILRQIPVVAVMIVIGYVASFWEVSLAKRENNLKSKRGSNFNSDLKCFFIAFSPILTTILVVACLEVASLGLTSSGLDVFLATLIGLVVLILISKPSLHIFKKLSKSWEIYGIMFAAYGAFLLKNVAISTGISETFGVLATSGIIGIILLLTLVPAFLGFVTGSPSGGVAIGVSILAGTLTFSPKIAALLYMSAYLGYVIAPTHLCFAFTIDYFKCSLSKVYKYMIPSFLISFVVAILVYLLF